MPVLDGAQIAERLKQRLEKLRSGEDVAKREVEALLTDEQIAEMNTAWAEQQQLRKQKRARTKEEEIALGWKSKRDIQIAAYERAIAHADVGILDTLDQLQRKVSVRRARVYLDSYFKASDEGKPHSVARNRAENDLTRARLKRIDAQTLGHQNQRDKVVSELEENLLKSIQREKTAAEHEQLELVKIHEKSLFGRLKKSGK